MTDKRRKYNWQEIQRQYDEENISVREILRRNKKMGWNTIKLAEKRGEFKQRPDFPKCREDMFEKINDPETAYWLGFLFADGYVDEKRNNLTLDLALKDENQIDRFIKFSGYKNKKYYLTRLNKYHSVSVRMTSKKLTSDLVKLGCTQNKSKTVRFPNIPKEMVKPFVLGVYDGDGGDYQICSGSKEFLGDISEKLKLNKSVTNRKSCYVLYLGKRNVWKIQSTFKNSMPRKRLLKEPLGYRAKRIPAKNKVANGPNSALDIPNKRDLSEMLKTMYITEIARQVGCTDNNIRRHCVTMGLTMPKRWYVSRRKKGMSHQEAIDDYKKPKNTIVIKIRPEDLSEIKKLRDSGLTFREIGHKYNCGHDTILRRLRSYENY